jgi:glycosyltransferase involved in cell wall biosynthesis
MKYPNTGLYHYCLQLGKAIQRNLNGNSESLQIYVRAPEVSAFGPDYDIIHQHSLHKFYMPYQPGMAVWHCTYQGSNYFPFRKKLPVVLTIHDLNFLYDEHKSDKKKEKYLKKHAEKIHHAQHIVAISDYVMEDIKKHFDVSEKKCSVIYNGCNISASTLPALSLDKTPGVPFLFTIGTVVDKKNFHVLPPLLEGNNRQLIISGVIQSEDYKAKILAVAREHGVENRVIFTGPITEAEKYWYMQNCEAFLFPSLAEGFGLPVIEAMYFGRPVILSTHTSLPEIGGDAAYYFPDFNPARMRKILQESLDHYDLNQPAEKIKERALSFNWDKAASEYLEIYRSFY